MGWTEAWSAESRPRWMFEADECREKVGGFQTQRRLFALLHRERNNSRGSDLFKEHWSALQARGDAVPVSPGLSGKLRDAFFQYQRMEWEAAMVERLEQCADEYFVA